MKPVQSPPPPATRRQGLLSAAGLSFSVRFICILFISTLLVSVFSEAGDAQAPDVEVGAVTGSVGPPSGPIVQPPPTIAPTGVSGCTDGTYVKNPRRNTGLVSDCQALIAISKHWTGRSGNVGLPGRHPLRTWGAGNSRIGSWAGVSVSNRRVTGLDLHVGRNAAGSRISGPLPTQLGDLTSLRHLNLSGNKLKGSIPEELGDLTDLKQLYLDGNNLTGSIPEELGDLNSLKQLHLSGNKLAGSIPEELGGSDRPESPQPERQQAYGIDTGRAGGSEQPESTPPGRQ